MITSGCTGWAPNEARMFSSPSIWGPWKQYPNPCMGENAYLTFGGQSTNVLKLPGKEDAFIFMADIWRPNKPSDARYIWLPITFRRGKPVIEWKDSWTLEEFEKEQSDEPLISTDSIRLSDPCVLADRRTATYYMTGTGGMLWKSKDLHLWSGPYKVAQTDSTSWMGKKPMIWAAELHAYHDKYYYFATFTNQEVKIDTVGENVIERRASHVLVSDSPDGPYVPMQDSIYLPADKPTLDGTFWVDKDGKPYMVYCYEWLQNNNGTIEKIELKEDLSGSIGEGKLLFRASDSPWSRETTPDGSIKPNKVTDGPYLFRTGTGRLGMIWTSWVENVYTQGVAYSKSGTLDGPWIHEKEPITPPNFGHGMLFRTFEGKWLMSVHSHYNDRGHYVRVPHFFEVDFSGDKLVVGKEYIPGM